MVSPGLGQEAQLRGLRIWYRTASLVLACSGALLGSSRVTIACAWMDSYRTHRFYYS